MITSSLPSTRIENRVPGADANPYLAMAASLGAGLYGIEHQLILPAKTEGDALNNYKAALLAMSLDEATSLMDQSDKVRSIMGDAFVDHYCTTRRWEWQQFRKSVTDWEWKRYRHII
jgi:glutamine synthetase